MADFVLYLLLSTFFTHELDAVKRHEWRMFPGLHMLRDGPGFAVFTLAHVPLFALIIRLTLDGGTAQELSRILFAGFGIVHVGLHLAYARHPANEFDNPLSQLLIWGTGLLGALYLGLILIFMR